MPAFLNIACENVRSCEQIHACNSISANFIEISALVLNINKTNTKHTDYVFSYLWFENTKLSAGESGVATKSLFYEKCNKKKISKQFNNCLRFSLPVRVKISCSALQAA